MTNKMTNTTNKTAGKSRNALISVAACALILVGSFLLNMWQANQTENMLRQKMIERTAISSFSSAKSSQLMLDHSNDLITTSGTAAQEAVTFLDMNR